VTKSKAKKTPQAAQRDGAPIETARLLLRRPEAKDADTIFGRYAADAEVTKYLGWKKHASADDTRTFLAWSDEQWAKWPAGPLLVFAREGGELLGTTGLAFETPQRASTGFAFAKDSWGKGYATEALSAMAKLAKSLGVRRLYALCHPEHKASAKVLERCGFEREGLLRRFMPFPNLGGDEPSDVLCYSHLP
jgi:RimJ/RimL family protein N-acetyltransferase